MCDICFLNIIQGNMIFYLEDIYNFTDVSCDTSISLMPSERIEKACRYYSNLDKKICVLTYLLLKYALQNEYNINPSNKLEFGYSQFQKPYLKRYPDIHVNLSHCKAGISCAVSNSPIGVDIQELEKYSQKFFKRILTNNEIEIIEKNIDKTLFTQIWVAKECYVKCLGTGIWDNINKYDFSSSECSYYAYGYFFNFYKNSKNYVIGSCSQYPQEKFIRVCVNDVLQCSK